ncbi:MAG: PQQ-binding-like beta-propeller repeat protein [Deltaproteobacteria bacterium]|nr:PQQ-binding-like beta-propeller repeat protein [Deltaproteobacteria bacterium]
MKTTPMMKTLAAMGGVALLASCGGSGAFSGDRSDNDVAMVRACVHKQGPARPLAVANSTGKPMGFLVSTPQPKRRMIAFDLASKQKVWDVEADVSSRVVVGKGQVFAREGNALVARDVASGKKLWSVGLKGKLLGIAADRDGVFYAAETSGGNSVLVGLSASSGSEWWSNAAKGKVGAPAARSGEVFVPYLSQYLTVLDARSGKEEARIRQKDEAITFVRATEQGVFYGSSRVFMFNEKSCTGTAKGATNTQVALPKDFKDTSYQPNAYSTVSADYTALDRNRLIWQGAVSDDGVSFAGGIAVVQFYRFFFALDAATGKLSWAHTHPRVDVVGAESTGTALAYVSSEGELRGLDGKTGGVSVLGKVDARISGGTFDIGAWSAPEGDPVKGLASELAKIVWDPDRRYDDIKLFAVEALATLDGPEVAEELLHIVVREGIKPEVYKKAGDALVARKDAAAAPALLEQLEVHTDYVTGAKAFGVDVIARALGELGAGGASAGAVPALVAHLEDPATPLETLAEIAGALGKLGAPEAAAPLAQFILTYRSDPMFAVDPGALARAIESLALLGGPRDIELLRFVADDERTQDKVREYVRRVLEQRDAGKAEAPKAADSAAGGKG